MNIDPRLPTDLQPTPAQQQLPQHNWLKILGIVVVASCIATLVALWAVNTYLFPSAFKPVTLSTSEKQVLENKLERLERQRRIPALHRGHTQSAENKPLQPERYSEQGADRQIILSERELNALLAKNTNLAPRLAINLSRNLASAKLLIPLDEEMPLFGGKTLKVTAGLELAYQNNKPVVMLRGVSIWGVPIPNAWLGNMKNVDLVSEFGNQKGFWKAFADGIDEVEVSEGQLRVKLKE